MRLILFLVRTRVQLILHYPETFCWQLSPQEFPRFFPPPHAHFFFVQGQCVPGHFQAFFPLFLIALLHSGIEDMTWRCQMRTVRRIMDTVVQWRIVRIWGNNDETIPYGETDTIHMFQHESKTNLRPIIMLTGRILNFKEFFNQSDCFCRNWLLDSVIKIYIFFRDEIDIWL